MEIIEYGTLNVIGVKVGVGREMYKCVVSVKIFQ